MNIFMARANYLCALSEAAKEVGETRKTLNPGAVGASIPELTTTIEQDLEQMMAYLTGKGPIPDVIAINLRRSLGG